MARVRSPNYPALSLPDALSRVQKVHAAEQHLAAPREVIAKHLGYNGLNGASIKIVSAIVKYGLLEEASGDRLKVSPLALSILYPSDEGEKARAIKEAAFKPPLFEEINSEWGGVQPSDANLRSWLFRRNFAADAIDRVIQSYRETMELVARETRAYDPPSAPEAQSMTPAPQQPAQALPSVPVQVVHTLEDREPYRVSLTRGALEGAFRLELEEDADELIRAINAWKLLLRPLPQKAGN